MPKLRSRSIYSDLWEIWSTSCLNSPKTQQVSRKARLFQYIFGQKFRTEISIYRVAWKFLFDCHKPWIQFWFKNFFFHSPALRGTSGIDIDLRRVDIDQCPQRNAAAGVALPLNIFAGTDKCKQRTTEVGIAKFSYPGDIPTPAFRRKQIIDYSLTIQTVFSFIYLPVRPSARARIPTGLVQVLVSSRLLLSRCQVGLQTF